MLCLAGASPSISLRIVMNFNGERSRTTMLELITFRISKIRPGILSTMSLAVDSQLLLDL